MNDKVDGKQAIFVLGGILSAPCLKNEVNFELMIKEGFGYLGDCFSKDDHKYFRIFLNALMRYEMEEDNLEETIHNINFSSIWIKADKKGLSGSFKTALIQYFKKSINSLVDDLWECHYIDY